jgi:hypothetical protein
VPWLGVGLAYIGSMSAGREQPLQLMGLFSFGDVHIDV